MSDEISSDLVAFYRANAVEEPDASLDTAILRAARPRRLSPVAFASLAVVLLAVTVIAVQPVKPARHSVVAGRSETPLPPGMTDGRDRLLAASAKPQRIGMTVQPMAAAE